MRGDVLRIRATHTRGHEQTGERYGVVVQADQFSPLSTVVVCPTSISAQPSSFRPLIDFDGTPTRVLVDQIRAVDYERAVIAEVGHLLAHEMAEIDRALARFLGLP